MELRVGWHTVWLREDDPAPIDRRSHDEMMLDRFAVAEGFLVLLQGTVDTSGSAKGIVA